MTRSRPRKAHPGRLRFKDFRLRILLGLVGGLLLTVASLPSIFGGESSVLLMGIIVGPLAILLSLALLVLLAMVRVSRIRYYRRLIDYRDARVRA